MSTRITTGKVRFSYVHIFKPYAYQPGQDEKYSICLLIPKKDEKTVRKIRNAIICRYNDRNTELQLPYSRRR